MKQKELYAAPETEVLELRLEGVIATSPNGGLDNFTEEGMTGSWGVPSE